jgi:hypothetical protein
MKIGVVIERRETDNQWIDHTWQVVSLILGAAEVDQTNEIGRGQGWVQFHAATLPLELFRKETEGYKYNLSLHQPSVFVVLRDDDDDGSNEVIPFMATVCPYEAQDYMDSSEETVQSVPMPDTVASWLAEFVETNHVDEPFKKRKRKAFDPRKEGFYKPPPRVSKKWDRSNYE